MKINVLRYDKTEDGGGRVTSAFMTISVTDQSIPNAISRSEHTLSEEEILLVGDGLIGEVAETVSAEALDRLKEESESKPKIPVSAEKHELDAIASEVRPEYVLAKQLALEEKRKNSQTGNAFENP